MYSARHHYAVAFVFSSGIDVADGVTRLYAGTHDVSTLIVPEQRLQA